MPPAAKTPGGCVLLGRHGPDVSLAAERSARSPEAWIVCETYSNPEPRHGPEKVPGFGDSRPAWSDEALAKFPAGVFVQWVGDMAARPWYPWTPAGASPPGDITTSCGPTSVPIGADSAASWRSGGSPKWSSGASPMVSTRFAVWRSVAFPRRRGTERPGGRSAVQRTRADLDLFLAEVAGLLLGGGDQAREYLRFGALARRTAAESRRLEEHLRDVPLCRRWNAVRRWIWLANDLASFIYPEPPT